MWQTFLGNDSFYPLPCYTAEIIVVCEKTYICDDR